MGKCENANGKKKKKERIRFAAALAWHKHTKLNGKLMRKHSAAPPQKLQSTHKTTHTRQTINSQKLLPSFRCVCIHSTYTYEPVSCFPIRTPTHSLPTSHHLPSSFAHTVFVMYVQFYHFNGFVIYLHVTQTHIHTQHERACERANEREI